MKVGDCIKFIGISGIEVYGYIAKIDDADILYVRNSLTRWSTSKELVERTGSRIPIDTFISYVKDNTKNTSDEPIPSDDQIMSVLKK